MVDETKRAGRPSALDDQAIVDELCNRVSSGEGILEVCRDEHMPAERTVYGWMARDEVFRSRITKAREAQQEAEADKMVLMADAATPEDYQVVKLRIWARQWRAAKLAPKKYGERQTVEHEGTVEHRHTPSEAREKVEDFLSRKQAELVDPATKH